MERIVEPKVVVSDGANGLSKALRKVWPHSSHQRCLFHIFCQVRRYTTSRPKTLAGKDLYSLAKALFIVCLQMNRLLLSTNGYLIIAK